MTTLTRKKKLYLTSVFSLVNQLTAIIAGFILPKLLLVFFGSEVNGIVISVTQFLSLISFLDMGIGQVVQSNLYKPLADKDYNHISEILVSGRRFFRRLAQLFIIYTIILSFVYPLIRASSFDFWFVFLLIYIISINSFSQYYFGIAYQLLLNSDQRGYIINIVQTTTLILNVGLSVIMLYSGFGIHTVKLFSAFVYLLRPMVMYLYVKRTYPAINLKIGLNYEPIKQKWNGFAQHMASVVLNNTDVIVLTLFSTLTNISIYSIYNLVIMGVKQLLTSVTSGIQPIFGELWAKNRIKELKELFGMVEWAIHSGTVLVFGCTSVLLLPFVKVYTEGITDANYLAPTFALVLTLAHAFHSIRLPYNLMVLAGGHFKETQHSYVVSAAINIGISVITVSYYGLVGVAIGTLIAMTYQTLWLVIYLSKHFFKWELKIFARQILVDITIVTIGCTMSGLFELSNISYFSWFVLALKTLVLWSFIFILVNILFYKERITKIFYIVTARQK